MNKRVLGKAPAVLIIAVITLIVFIGATTAWIIVNETHEFSRLFNVSNFNATADVYFESDGGTVYTLNSASPYVNADGTFNVELSNTSAPNYIDNLRLNVNYTGKGSALIRIKAVHQFISNGKIISVNAQIPYTVSDAYTSAYTGNQLKWFDNRANDYCYYLATPVHGADNVTTYNMGVISGIDTSLIPSFATGTTLTVAFELDAVQVNRYTQFWGIAELPWVNAETNTDMELT